MGSKVVIIGGSYAAHAAFKTVFSLKNVDIDLATIIAQNSKSYFNVAGPRLLSEPQLAEKTLFSISDFVANNGKGKGKFVHGKVVGVDFDKKTVTVRQADSEPRDDIKVAYDILIIATGTTYGYAGFKVNELHESAILTLLKTNKRLKTAKSVAVVGGGPTGVESAGEIAYQFKGTRVTLYTGSEGPLSLFPTLAKTADRHLRTLGVEIVNGVKISKLEQGKTSDRLETALGESKTYDVILDAFSYSPNTDAFPDSILDGVKYIRTDPYFNVVGASGVLALGDVVSGTCKTIVDLQRGQLPVFKKSLAHLLGHDKELKIYLPVTNLLIVPISRNGGVGLFFGWRLPSFLVWLLKCRTFMVERAAGELS